MQNYSVSLKDNTIIALVLILFLMLSFSGRQQVPATPSVGLDGTQTIAISSPSNYLNKLRTHNFIKSTRSIIANNASSVDQIYYRIATLYDLDPTLANLPGSLKSVLANQLVTFYNPDGGFGNWKYDLSGLSSTNKALHVLNWTNSLNLIDTPLSTLYLDGLRNSLTNGFVSHKYDPDSDVYSSYLAVEAYNILGVTPANITDVKAVFIRAQNDNVTAVGANQLWGFGKQTNNLKGIYWTSEATVTRAALEALKYTNALGQVDASSAATFVSNLQTTSGGFVNDPLVTSTKITAAYTSSAIDAILLGGGTFDQTKATQYIMSLEDTNGGFKLSTTSTASSLIGTYFAVHALNAMGASPSNVTKTEEYLLNGGVYTDGYGSSPGAEASLRETFDAIFALNLTNNYPSNPSGILAYVDSYRNLDGGYGLTSSFTESTYRAVAIYDMLGMPFPNPSTTISFLQGLQQADGGFSKGAAKTISYVISSYRAVSTLSILGAQPTNRTAAVNYFNANHNSDGGFGGFVGDISDVSSTYRAVRGVELLGGAVGNTTGTIAFLQSSQNPDGGFRRSKLDITLPNNSSSAIYSYSSYRALKILGSRPTDMNNLWYFLKDIRNIDGGFGLRDLHTSDIAYTFTSLWIINHLHEESGFSIELPDNLASLRAQYDNVTVGIVGGILNYTVTPTISNGSGVLFNAVWLINSTSNFVVDTSMLSVGNYTLDLLLVDDTGATISYTGDLFISDTIVTSSTTPQVTPTNSSANTVTSSNSTTSNVVDTTSTTQSSVSSTAGPPTVNSPSITPPSVLNEFLPFIVFGGGALLLGMAYMLFRRK